MGATLIKAFANPSPAASREPLLDEFRAAMRELAGAVSVISCGQGKRRAGFAATSVSSLSLDPPTLILCVNRSSSSRPILRQARSFGVNILSASHRELAHRCARPDRRRGFAALRERLMDYAQQRDAAPKRRARLVRLLARRDHRAPQPSHRHRPGRSRAAARRRRRARLLARRLRSTGLVAGRNRQCGRIELTHRPQRP
jgi:hypothetical protein